MANLDTWIQDVLYMHLHVYMYLQQLNTYYSCVGPFQIESSWKKTCEELAAMPQLEPTLIQHMLCNIATAISTMENELPGLEVNGLKLDNVQAKERKARVSHDLHVHV